jgi:hypothetical protein
MGSHFSQPRTGRELVIEAPLPDGLEVVATSLQD